MPDILEAKKIENSPKNCLLGRNSLKQSRLLGHNHWWHFDFGFQCHKCDKTVSEQTRFQSLQVHMDQVNCIKVRLLYRMSEKKLLFDNILLLLDLVSVYRSNLVQHYEKSFYIELYRGCSLSLHHYTNLSVYSTVFSSCSAMIKDFV